MLRSLPTTAVLLAACGAALAADLPYPSKVRYAIYRGGNVIGQPLFVRWCRLMGNEDLAADPRFKDDLARGDNGEALSEIMQKWCGERTVSEALELLEANRIPAGAVYTPQQTLDDPHVREAGFFHAMEFPGTPKPVPVLQEPVKLSRTPLTIRSRAPKLGEHTDQILRDLGYDPAAIEKLRSDRVV